MTGVELSIIIPTYRRPGDLRGCLDAIDRADPGTLAGEVIVVDDGGGLPGWAAEWAMRLETRWISLPENRGQTAAQAAGVRAARGCILAFLDDDAAVASGWITAVEHFFVAYPDAPAVVGRIEPLDASSVYSRMRQQVYDRRHRAYTDRAFRTHLIETWHLPQASMPFLSDHISGGNFAIRRNALEAVGGIIAGVWRGGDRLFSQAILSSGRAIGYDPEMIIFHRHHHGVVFLIRNSLRVGRSLAELNRQQNPNKNDRLAFGLRSLIRAPFRIRQAPELWAADPSRVKVYLAYTFIQLCEALGQFDFTRSRSKHA